MNLELANVITLDVLKAQMDERLQAIEQGKQEIAKLGQQIESIKANLTANDGAAQQLKILIDMCEKQAEPDVTAAPDAPDVEANAAPAEVPVNATTAADSSDSVAGTDGGCCNQAGCDCE